MRRWEEIRPELSARGVEIVTICTDTPEKIRNGRSKHGLEAVMLADPDLRVTDLYGLRNQRIQTGPPGRPQPVPTTILADASGTVRWIDQSRDYQRRSDPDVVRAALRACLDDRSPPRWVRSAASGRRPGWRSWPHSARPRAC